MDVFGSVAAAVEAELLQFFVRVRHGCTFRMLRYAFYESSRIAGDDGVGLDIPGHYAAGSDHSIFADCDTRQDCRSGANPCIFPILTGLQVMIWRS